MRVLVSVRRDHSASRWINHHFRHPKHTWTMGGWFCTWKDTQFERPSDLFLWRQYLTTLLPTIPLESHIDKVQQGKKFIFTSQVPKIFFCRDCNRSLIFFVIIILIVIKILIIYVYIFLHKLLTLLVLTLLTLLTILISPTILTLLTILTSLLTLLTIQL